MIWFALFTLAIAGFIVIGAFVEDSGIPKKQGLMTAGAVAGVALALSAAAHVTVVNAGHVGIPVVFGSVSEKSYNEGVRFINPFATVIEMSVRTENYWMSHQGHEGAVAGDDAVQVRSANGLEMPVDIVLHYRLMPEAAPWVYRNFGHDYVNKIIRPTLSTAARRAASGFTAEELYSSKREKFSQTIQQNIEEEFEKITTKSYSGNAPKNAITFSQVLVGRIGLPPSVKAAIEAKLQADQEQQAMEFKILKEKKEAERKMIEAEGIQKFQEIVTKGIDERLLRWKGIEATLQLANSPNSKIIVIGAGRDGLPLLLGNAANHDSKPVENTDRPK